MKKKEETCEDVIILQFFDAIHIILALMFTNFWAKEILALQNYAKKNP